MRTTALRRTFAAVAILVATNFLPAQVRPGIFGYLVRGQNGAAGEFCHVFDCTPRPLNVVRGETLTLEVNAPFLALYAIGASLSATNCQQLPLVANALILNPPIITLSVGVITGTSPVLSCWGGQQLVPLTVPQTLPVGSAFSTQAMADAAGVPLSVLPALSVAVTATVR